MAMDELKESFLLPKLSEEIEKTDQIEDTEAFETLQEQIY